MARVKTHVLLRHALQRLKAQNEALAEAQETLERRVEERTRALQASEAHHRAITRSAVDGILALDHEWRVTSWNLAAARLFGWVEEEMLGETPKRLVREEEHEALMLGLKWLLREGAFYGGNKSLGVNALHRSGARRPIEISLSSWESEGRPAYAVTVRDLRED